MKLYKGTIATNGDLNVLVRRDTDHPYRLPHAVYHSPTGFGAGHHGSGPADLALAILLDLTNERKALPFECFEREPLSKARRAIEQTVAWRLHQRFKRVVVALLPQDEPWALHSEPLEAWLEVNRKPAEYEVIEERMYAYIGATVRALPGAIIRAFGGEYLAIPEGGITFEAREIRPGSVEPGAMRAPKLILRQNNWPQLMQDVYTTKLDNIEFVQFPKGSEDSD